MIVPSTKECFINFQMAGTVKAASQNITQAELDKSLQQQAEGYISVLDQKESMINEVHCILRTL